MSVLTKRGEMLGGARAAIGNQQELVGQMQKLPQQVILLFDAGVAVAIAVEEMAGHGHGAEIIDDGGHAELQHFIFSEVTTRDVSGRIFEILHKLIERSLRSRLGMFVSAVEDEMSGIEVAAFQGAVGEPQHRAGNLGQDGMPLFKEGVQGACQSVVVDFVGRNVAEVLDAMFGSPLGDVAEGGGLVPVEPPPGR